jgi:hypothetical protein
VTDQQSTLSLGDKTVNSAADRGLDNARFLDALKKIVRPRHVLTSPASTRAYRTGFRFASGSARAAKMTPKRRAGTVGSKAPGFLVCVIAIGIGTSARSQSAKYHAHPGFMSFLVSVFIIRPNDKTSWIVWSYQSGLLELIDIRDMHALRSAGQHLDSPKSAFVALAMLAAMRRASSRLQCEWVPSPKIVATIGSEVEARRPKGRNITENLCAVMP